MKTALCVTALLGLCASPVGSQTVGLSGMLGAKALVIVDGSAPKVMAPGETFRGGMPYVLVGNRSLSRAHRAPTNDQLNLDKRY